MRQIGQDLAQDPREPIVTKDIGQPDLNNPASAQALAQFTWNKYAEMSHRYCSSSLNLGSSKNSEVEQQRFQTCLGKYQEAFSLYKQEENVHYSALEAIDRVGGDKFAKLNEYDRF